jgi:peptide/nickel transport system ATP-binding protein
VLTVSGLTKSYGAAKALDEVDLNLKRGETLTIVGESGSGKSTLARLLVRLTEPSAGAAMIDGTDFLRLRGGALRRRRSLIQMIFQDPFGSLNPRRSVGDILTRAGVLSGRTRGEAKTRAIELLELVGLKAEAFHRKPSAFSGGQRQRIGIARAVAMNPQILIADESVSALDVSVQTQVLKLLADLQARFGLALLFITHDLRVAAELGGRVAVMHKGRVVEQGDASQVLVAPRDDYTRALIAAVPGRDRI